MGRVQLVKYVIQDMTLYSFHIYARPKNLLKVLDTQMRIFQLVIRKKF